MSDDSRLYAMEVRRLKGAGITNTAICKYLNISKDVLISEYSDILNRAAIDKNVLVANELFDQACAGNMAAIQFWLKNIGKWEKLQDEIDEIDTKQELITDINITIGTTKADFGLDEDE